MAWMPWGTGELARPHGIVSKWDEEAFIASITFSHWMQASSERYISWTPFLSPSPQSQFQHFCSRACLLWPWAQKTPDRGVETRTCKLKESIRRLFLLFLQLWQENRLLHFSRTCHGKLDLKLSGQAICHSPAMSWLLTGNTHCGGFSLTCSWVRGLVFSSEPLPTPANP